MGLYRFLLRTRFLVPLIKSGDSCPQLAQFPFADSRCCLLVHQAGCFLFHTRELSLSTKIWILLEVEDSRKCSLEALTLRDLFSVHDQLSLVIMLTFYICQLVHTQSTPYFTSPKSPLVTLFYHAIDEVISVILKCQLYKKKSHSSTNKNLLKKKPANSINMNCPQTS